MVVIPSHDPPSMSCVQAIIRAQQNGRQMSQSRRLADCVGAPG